MATMATLIQFGLFGQGVVVSGYEKNRIPNVELLAISGKLSGGSAASCRWIGMASALSSSRPL